MCSKLLKSCCSAKAPNTPSKPTAPIKGQHKKDLEAVPTKPQSPAMEVEEQRNKGGSSTGRLSKTKSISDRASDFISRTKVKFRSTTSGVVGDEQGKEGAETPAARGKLNKTKSINESVSDFIKRNKIRFWSTSGGGKGATSK
uniref:Uncharacterized protein n=1 Tax=Nelumbo nucifera TaxID=4432 RepID=A0A822XKN6_NELNU|nr:TPA_asm: hypothetical protein HUJ06_020838 [Nelumbo nucifera]